MSAFTPKYQFKSGTRIDKTIDAQKVGELCNELSSTVGLTPKTLLDANRTVDTPLYNYFEWRNDVAAEKYREEQARYIIRSVVVVEEKKPVVRAFCSIVVDAPDNKTEFKPINSIIVKEDWRTQMFENAKKDLFTFQVKYNALRDYAELSGVFTSIERLKD